MNFFILYGPKGNEVLLWTPLGETLKGKNIYIFHVVEDHREDVEASWVKESDVHLSLVGFLHLQNSVHKLKVIGQNGPRIASSRIHNRISSLHGFSFLDFLYI